MAIRNIVKEGDPILNKVCRPVTNFDDRLATLLDKPSRRKAPVYARYSCFEVPDAFVVGYGLDYNEKYRNLPYIGVLKPEIYMAEE